MIKVCCCSKIAGESWASVINLSAFSLHVGTLGSSCCTLIKECRLWHTYWLWRAVWIIDYILTATIVTLNILEYFDDRDLSKPQIYSSYCYLWGPWRLKVKEWGRVAGYIWHNWVSEDIKLRESAITWKHECGEIENLGVKTALESGIFSFRLYWKEHVSCFCVLTWEKHLSWNTSEIEELTHELIEKVKFSYSSNKKTKWIGRES